MSANYHPPQNHPHAVQQGLPPIQPLHQHVRHPGIAQQRNPNSPHQPQYHHPSANQGPYLSPHSSTQSLPPQQYQSPYLGSVHGETTFFGAHPSPYSTNSVPGSYASSEQSDNMATQTAMSRQPYPPISSYQTPQSNSPASIHSPHTDAHGRPMYNIPPMQQPTYYQPSYHVQQAPYGYAPPTSHHPSISSAPPQLMSYPPAHHPAQHPQHDPNHPQQGMNETKPTLVSLQRPPSVMAPPRVLPQTPSTAMTPSSAVSQTGPPSASSPNNSAAPGPIPATTPLVVAQDHDGTQWIQFEYSRDRVKMMYKIRCDVESVNLDQLSTEFKSANCVYPRAMCNRDQYKGNRLNYETECNQVGWALAQLNAVLREKRGLIQRAVDSWRNSNQDVRLRSRRVRRMAKMHGRKSTQQAGSSAAGQPPGHQGPVSAGPQNPQAGAEYGTASTQHHHQQPLSTPRDDMLPSSSSGRVAQNFDPLRPRQLDSGYSVMPSIKDGLEPVPSNAAAFSRKRKAEEDDEEDEESRHSRLFGDIPKSKRRKFILVDDPERGGARMRVRVMLDQVKMDDMPDAHLKLNAVYPRSYYPRQIGSPTALSRAGADWDDEDDEPEGASGTMPTRGKTMVKVPLMDGSETKLAVPRMTKSKRSKEIDINEMGYRMSWGQARLFNGRTLFLQRSLDAYRNKMRNIMLAHGKETSTIPPHFVTRPGKRVWTERERGKRERRVETPTKRAQSP